MQADTRAPALGAAIARYRAGAFAEAADALAALGAEAPEDAALLRLHGLALTRAGRAAAALPPLARARRLDFAQPLAHLHYGIALLAAGRPARPRLCRRLHRLLRPRTAARRCPARPNAIPHRCSLSACHAPAPRSSSRSSPRIRRCMARANAQRSTRCWRQLGPAAAMPARPGGVRC